MRKQRETLHMSRTNKDGVRAALVLVGEPGQKPETSPARCGQLGSEHRKGAGTELIRLKDVRPRGNRARRMQ